MSEAILAAIITAAATVAAQLFISRRERESRERSLIEQNSRIVLRLERLEAAVEKQSGLFERIYKTEADMAVLKSRIDIGNIRC